MFDLSSHSCPPCGHGQYSPIIIISDRRMFFTPFKPHLVVKGIAYRRTERGEKEVGVAF